MDELCPGKVTVDDFLMKEFYLRRFPPQLMRNMELFVYNSTADMQDICKKNVQYKAEVIFKLATNTMAVTVNSRRLSFFDKLSGFGKISLSSALTLQEAGQAKSTQKWYF